MKKNNKLFVLWGVIVVIVVSLLTILGFMLKSKNSDYKELEDKLIKITKKYVDANFLYPNGNDTVKITSKELVENDYLDELKFENDVCTGYVVVSYNNVYSYKAYITCDKYTTNGYEK